MDIRYIQAVKVDFDPRPQMGMIFAEGFSHHFEAFSKDTKLLAKAFSHIFDLQYFYVAVSGNEITAMAACTDGISPLRFNKAICRKELGFLRGWIAYAQLTKHMVNHKFPFDFISGMGRIEIVGTAAEHQGKGMAYNLLKHIIESTPYTEYILEVFDDNVGAVKLYEKLGFETFKKVNTVINAKTNAFLYMKCTSE
jgi:ribosomal protein S18 acetylase RimI-like enzyme